jgi:hypothetical protein
VKYSFWILIQDYGPRAVEVVLSGGAGSSFRFNRHSLKPGKHGDYLEVEFTERNE